MDEPAAGRVAAADAIVAAKKQLARWEMIEL